MKEFAIKSQQFAEIVSFFPTFYCHRLKHRPKTATICKNSFNFLKFCHVSFTKVDFLLQKSKNLPNTATIRRNSFHISNFLLPSVGELAKKLQQFAEMLSVLCNFVTFYSPKSICCSENEKKFAKNRNNWQKYFRILPLFFKAKFDVPNAKFAVSNVWNCKCTIWIWIIVSSVRNLQFRHCKNIKTICRLLFFLLFYGWNRLQFAT